MNLKDTLKGSTLKARALYRCVIAILDKDIWGFNKDKQLKQDDKHLIVFLNATKKHQKRLQTYHDLIVKKKKQDRSM